MLFQRDEDQKWKSKWHWLSRSCERSWWGLDTLKVYGTFVTVLTTTANLLYCNNRKVWLSLCNFCEMSIIDSTSVKWGGWEFPLIPTDCFKGGHGHYNNSVGTGSITCPVMMNYSRTCQRLWLFYDTVLSSLWPFKSSHICATPSQRVCLKWSM